MGRIPDEDVAKVRDANDVVAVVSDRVALKRKGRLFWGLCPFHGEKTASFKVDPGTQLWHCFGCGQGGDVFGFVMRADNVDFPDAVRLLADRARIDIREEGGGVPRSRRERLIDACEAAADHYHRTLLTSKAEGAKGAREYLHARGFGIDAAKRWRLGYATQGRDELSLALLAKGFASDEIVEANLAVDDRGRAKDRFFGRLMFPIADLSGRVIAFGGRILGEGNPKYLNSQETPVFHKSSHMYGIHEAKAEIVRSGTAVVVEGYTDVIALHEAGVRDAVATLGTALTQQHVKLLGRFAKRVVYLFDGDEAGMRAARRAGEFIDWRATPEAGQARVDLDVAVVPAGLDPADLVAERGVEGVREVLDGAVPLLRFVIDSRLDEHDLASPEGRAAALASAAGVLAGLQGSLLMQDYANHVAGRLLVDYATVQRAVRRARPEVSVGGDAEPEERAGGRTAGATDPQVRTERELARLAALSPEVRPEARELLLADVVTDPATRALIELVLEAGGLVGGELYRAVAENDPAAAEALSPWLVDESDADDVPSLFRGVAARLKEFALRRRIIGLRAKMDGLDPVKDGPEFDDLFRQVAALQRELDGTVQP